MSQTNIAAIQSMYAAFGRGDVAAIVNNCVHDVAWHSGGDPKHYPGFEPRKGHDGVQKFFATVAELLEFSEFTPREFYSDRDKVFVLGYYAMTVRKNGRPYASDWIHIFTFRDGKVAKFREFMDTAGIADAWRE